VTDTNDAGRRLAELLTVMAALRTPDTGCPWDLVQTFETIAPYTIEEAYEVADAIARGDLTDLRDELGDLLLQVVYHARIAEERGAFAFADVATTVTAKMLRRHPHVFGTAEERAAGAAPGFWERIKAAERAEKAAERARLGGVEPRPPGVLGDVPAALPALTRALKLQEKAARVGFDWPGLAPVFDKLREEIAELEAAVFAHDATHDAAHGRAVRSGEIAEELGDLMFVVTNLARHLGVDPEAALRGANAKFTRRFAYIERRLADDGRTPDQSDLAEMDRLWDEAKGSERPGATTVGAPADPAAADGQRTGD
jgi:ATP diphosphatase